MNLLIIARECGPNQTGTALTTYNWMQMVKSFADISYLSITPQKNPGVAKHFYYQPTHDNWKSKAKKIWNYYGTDFPKISLKAKPDIVQIHTPYLFGFKKFFPDTPTLLVEHDLNWNLLEHDIAFAPTVSRLPFQFALIPWLKWRAKQFEKSALKKADRTLVCSPREREAIVKELPELKNKVEVIPHCLDVAAYSPCEKRGETVLFMGHMTYSANRDAVDVICQQIAPQLPHLPFQILGNGHYAKPYPKNVGFLGVVEDVKPHLENARVFIVPLRFGSGIRVKILEAFAMQRPVVATSKGAEGLEVEDKKNILIENDWPSFAKAIQELWDNPERAQTLARNGRRLVESRYDYRLYSKRVEQIYEKLLHHS